MHFIIIIEILIVVIAVSLAILPPKIHKIKTKQVNEYLKENGSIITARYVTTVEKKTKNQYGIHPYNIVCVGMDPLTGKEITFKSEDLENNPIKYIEDNNIKIFHVHINLDNTKQYYIDVEELKKHLK